MLFLGDATDGLPLARRVHRMPVSGRLLVASWLSVVVASLLVVTASAGLLYGGHGLYPSDADLLPQYYGQDGVALIVAVPTLLISMWTARRGSVRGLVIWLGSLIYVAYWYHFYLASVPFGPLFLIHVALVSTSFFALVVLLSRVNVRSFQQRVASGMPARTLGRFIAGIGSLFALAWVADVITRLANGEPLDPVARSVYVIDLTLMLPATIIGGVGLWKHRPWGYLIAGPLLVNAFASMVTLLTTTVLLDVSGEPAGPTQLIVVPVATVTIAVCLVVYLRDVRS